MKKKVLLVFAAVLLILAMATPAMAEPTPLDPPASVEWGVLADGTICPGAFCFDAVDGASGYVAVLWKGGVQVGNCNINSFQTVNGKIYLRSIFDKALSDNGDGSYIIRVRAKGNGVTTSVSDPAESAPYVYTTAPNQMAAPASVSWTNDGGIMFTAVANCQSYWVNLLKDGNQVAANHMSVNGGLVSDGNGNLIVSANTIQNLLSNAENVTGNPVYKVEVVALSPNIEQYTCSNSAYSDVRTLTKLDEPANPHWGATIDGVFKGNALCWEPVANCEGQMVQGASSRSQYLVMLYKDGQQVSFMFFGGYAGFSGKEIVIAGTFDNAFAVNGDGTYHFTVQALGDSLNNLNSNTVKSPDFVYKVPTVKLGSPSYADWDGTVARWSEVAGAFQYEVKAYDMNVSVTDPVMRAIVTASEKDADGNFTFDFTNMGLFEKQSQFYFEVTALPADIAASLVGDTVKSSILDTTKIEDAVVDSLNDLNNTLDPATTTTAQAIQFREDYLTAVTPEQVATSLTSPTAAKALKEAGEKYGEIMDVNVEFAVDENLSFPNNTEFSIAGAELNATSTGSTLTFKVSQATNNPTISDLEFKNTVLFDMNLIDKDGQKVKLDSAVYVTIPIPEQVKARGNLRILHFKDSTNEYETITPYIDYTNNTASFALTHFSTFAFVEVVETKPSYSGGGGGGGVSVGAGTTQKNEKPMVLTIGKNTVDAFGKTVTWDAAPIIVDGRTFAPARFVAEALGASVIWNENLRTVTITKDQIVIILTIDSKVARINGENVELDVAPFILNDRTYTPSRVVAEALGAKVDWDETARTVIITKK